jgi:hypothetical protein
MECSMTLIPENSDLLLTRSLVAAALTEAGYRITKSTLASKATRGGGPRYRLFGRQPLYRWGDALDWAQNRCIEPRHKSEQQSANAT